MISPLLMLALDRSDSDVEMLLGRAYGTPRCVSDLSFMSRIRLPIAETGGGVCGRGTWSRTQVSSGVCIGCRMYFYV